MTPITKQAHDDVYTAVREAMKMDGDKYYYINPSKEHPVHGMVELDRTKVIEPTNGGEKFITTNVKVDGFSFSGISVNLRKTNNGKYFVSISYPGYKTAKEDYVQYFHFREDGRGYDSKMKEQTSVDYKRIVEGMIVKEAKALIPEWAEKLESNK